MRKFKVYLSGRIPKYCGTYKAVTFYDAVHQYAIKRIDRHPEDQHLFNITKTNPSYKDKIFYPTRKQARFDV